MLLTCFLNQGFCWGQRDKRLHYDKCPPILITFPLTRLTSSRFRHSPTSSLIAEDYHDSSEAYQQGTHPCIIFLDLHSFFSYCMAHCKNCVTKLGNFVANSMYNYIYQTVNEIWAHDLIKLLCVKIEAKVVSSFVKKRQLWWWKTHLTDSEESMFASKRNINSSDIPTLTHCNYDICHHVLSISIY